MKKQTSKWTVLAAAMAVAGVFGLITSPAFADVHVSQNGATLTVTAPSTLAGKGLVLQTDAESSGAWTTKANIVGAVPAAGGSYTVDLASLGIANGTPCRIASATCYERLTMLLMEDRSKYIDTGIQGKNVYGVRMGFYPTQRGTGGTDDACFALNCGKGGDTGWVEGKGGFHIGLSQCTAEEKTAGTWNLRLEGPVLWGHQGYGSDSSERPNWETNAINHIAFTNRVFTLNGVIVKSGLHAGAISTNDLTVTMGRNNPSDSNNYYSLCGYWSYLQFDDENGELIVDYIPVRRTSDNKVGFWDSVSKTLVVPTTANQNLSASKGKPTGEIICDDSTLEVVADGIVPNRQLACSSEAGVVTISVPSGIAGERIIIAWDEADKGDDLAAWAHSATLTDSATAGTITQNLSRLGIRNGDCARVFAANVYKPLDMLQMTDINCYIDTGFLGTHVYGARAGFYATGQSGTAQSDFYYFMGCAKDGKDGGVTRGGFSVGEGAWFKSDGTVVNEPGKCRYIYRGDKNAAPTNTNLNTDCINEYVFTNRVFSLNGNVNTAKLSGKESVPWPSVEPMATNMTYNVYLGRCGHNKDATNANSCYAIFGWWSHVSLEDADGNNLIDYIPVQRVSDNKVGFYDRASLSFVTSSGSGTFTAGNVTNDTPVVAVNASSAAWEVTDIQGLIIIFK